MNHERTIGWFPFLEGSSIIWRFLSKTIKSDRKGSRVEYYVDGEQVLTTERMAKNSITKKIFEYSEADPETDHAKSVEATVDETGLITFMDLNGKNFVFEVAAVRSLIDIFDNNFTIAKLNQEVSDG